MPAFNEYDAFFADDCLVDQLSSALEKFGILTYPRNTHD